MNIFLRGFPYIRGDQDVISGMQRDGSCPGSAL